MTDSGDDERTFRVGDYVRVRAGVRDPDFRECKIGGWTGKIAEVQEDEDGDTFCTVRWDRKTRDAMSAELKARCNDEGIQITEMDLDPADLEPAEPPDQPLADSVEDLIQQMEDCDWPAPDILAAILAKGADAIEPLRDTIQRGAADPEVAVSADIAAGLLGELKAISAVPDLLRFSREGDEDSLEWTADALVRIGDVPVNELETMIRDTKLNSTRRAMALHVFEGIVASRSDLEPRLVTLLTDLLSDLTKRAKDHTMNEAAMTASVVKSLAGLAVPEARLAIDAAFKLGIVEEWAISKKDVERLYREGGRSRMPPTSFLDEYRKRHSEEESGDDEDDEGQPDEDEEGDWDDEAEDEDEDEGVAHAQEPLPAPVLVAKVGRNDPCPCGSGKKLKKCCSGKPAITAATVANALAAKLATREWNVEVELPPATPPKPGTIEAHPDVPKDLRRQVEQGRLESLVLMRALDQLHVFPTENDFPPELRALFEKDADCAESLWGLDQKLGKFNVALMLRNTKRALEALPAARSRVLAVLDHDDFAELEEIKNEVAASVEPDEAYNMVKGRDPDAV